MATRTRPTPNPNGHPETLVRAAPGNLLAQKHGVYSAGGRTLQPRADEIAGALMSLPHAQPLDLLAAQEIGSVIATLEAIDKALADGRVENKRGQARALIDLKGRLSRQLREWLREFGATPASRAEWAARLSRPSTGDLIQERLRKLEEADGVE